METIFGKEVNSTGLGEDGVMKVVVEHLPDESGAVVKKSKLTTELTGRKGLWALDAIRIVDSCPEFEERMKQEGFEVCDTKFIGLSLEGKQEEMVARSEGYKRIR